MDYHSCIKAPTVKHSPSSMNTQSTEVQFQIASSGELISLANEVFGTGSWSHSVTSQVIDFVEYIMGKYHAGCAAFVKVQLMDGTYHEDMGYSNAEGPTKGLAVFTARSASITNALRKTLLCFGGQMEQRIKDLAAEKQSVSADTISTIGEPQHFVKKGPPSPVANSTPKRSVSPVPPTNERGVLYAVNDAKRSKSPVPSSNVKENAVPPRSKNAMTEEELRLERKRKQKEKQEEYKRLMMLKEVEASSKPNPKY